LSFLQIGGLTLVQQCKMGQNEVVAQKFLRHSIERPK